MNFINEFRKYRVHEWKPLYVEYKLYMEVIIPFQKINSYQPQENKSIFKHQSASILYNSNVVNELNKSILDDLETLNSQLIDKISKDIEQCSNFFEIKLYQIYIKFRKIAYNIIIFQELHFKKSPISKASLLTLREACETLYLECKLLESFAYYNEKAIQKTIKMHKKHVFISYKHNLQQELENSKFVNKFEEIWKIEQKLLIVSSKCLGKRNLNVDGLLYRGFTIQEQLISGIYVGFSICLIIFIITRRVELSTLEHSKYFDLYFPMYRALGLLILYYWMLIFCVYSWQKGNVGYRQILGFRFHRSSIIELIKRAACITLLYLLILSLSILKEIQVVQNSEENFLVDQIMQSIYFQPSIGPLILWIFILIYMCFPSKRLCNGKGRIYFWKLIWKCLFPFCYSCAVVQHWATDQLLSLSIPIKDVAYTICYYYNYFISEEAQKECGNPKYAHLAIGLFPIFLRFIQVGRSAYDAKKYTLNDLCVTLIYVEVSAVTITSYLYSITNNIIPLIIASIMLGSTCYIWDVMKDWGLLERKSKIRKQYYLRTLLAYQPIIYYIAIILELFLRFNWVIIFADLYSVQYQVLLGGILEIFRRTVWNIFRIEYLHIENMGQFRAVNEMTLPFESFVDQQKYLQWKSRQNQIDPINNIFDSSMTSCLTYSNKSSMLIPEFEEVIKQQSKTDAENLQELIKKEKNLLHQTMFEDRRAESLAFKRFSDFRSTHLLTSSLEESKLIRQQIQIINKKLKTM